MGMQQSAARSHPLVLRSSWPVTLASVGAGCAGIAAVGLVTASWSLLWRYALVFAVVSLAVDRRRHLVLTDEGIAITGVRKAFVPWSHIERFGVRGSGRWAVRRIWVYDVVGNRSHTLQAPSACWGVGNPRVDRAYDEIRARWLAHRDGPRPPIEAWAPRPSG